MKTRTRDRCAICGERLEEPFINLPNYPITERYVSRASKGVNIDQGFCYCNNCGHGQLKTIIDKDILYGNYDYRTTTSTGGGTLGIKHLLNFMDKNITKDFRRIIEIGCNDGFLLRTLQNRADFLIGIDPNTQSRKEGNIEFIGNYYENVDIDTSNALIICNHVLEHLEEPRKFLQKLLSTANKNTIFLFSFPSLDYLIEDERFDQIFHHHLHYFSLNSILYLLQELGCEWYYEFNPNFWGSIYITFWKENPKQIPDEYKIKDNYILEKYVDFVDRMTDMIHYLSEHENQPIYAYGASYQLPILNYYVPRLGNQVKYILDDDKNKSGLFYQGMQQQIIQPDDEIPWTASYIIITAINFSRQILQNVIKRNPKRIYLPFNHI